MKSRNILTGLSLLLLLSCNPGSRHSSQENEISKYEQTMHFLQEKEEKNPVLFLSVTGKNKKNIIGQTVIKGTLKNNAKFAIYKDVSIKVNFYSDTGTLLESENETIYISIQPGESKKFKSKYFAPKGTGEISFVIINAKSGEN